jgi:phosphatidate cytidylyltransferase
MTIFVMYVLSLRSGEFRYQFNRFVIAIFAALIAVEATKANTDIYFYGVFWAIFVPLVVAVNDIMAYLCGMTFGKHPLIILSPKKT